MFANKPQMETSELDRTIASVHAHLSDYPPESKEYATMADQLVKFYALKKETPSWRVSPDTLVTVVGNLIVVCVIVAYEQRHVMASKALGFFSKVTR